MNADAFRHFYNLHFAENRRIWDERIIFSVSVTTHKEIDMTRINHNHYLAVPESGSGPGVLVLHAWWGLNDFMRGLCDRLAGEGFVVYAPDMFSGKVARTVEAAERLVHQSSEARDVPPILFSALEALGQRPEVSGKGLGAIGFSFGGFWALWLAAHQPEVLRAVTIFYAGGEGDFQPSQATFMGHFAETDPFEPEEGIRALEQSLKSVGRPTTFYTYPGTGHWFFESDRPDAYDVQAAQLAWERTVAFLHERLDQTR